MGAPAVNRRVAQRLMRAINAVVIGEEARLSERASDEFVVITLRHGEFDSLPARLYPDRIEVT